MSTNKAVPKTISALPDFWEKVDQTAQGFGLDRSTFVRIAVGQFIENDRTIVLVKGKDHVPEDPPD